LSAKLSISFGLRTRDFGLFSAKPQHFLGKNSALSRRRDVALTRDLSVLCLRVVKYDKFVDNSSASVLMTNGVKVIK
jgi:hypothetical protein